jgi:mannose-6-phosphate isomerase
VVADSHFFTEIIEVEGQADLKTDGRSFMAFIFLEGTAEISWDKGSLEVQAGHSVLIPANLGNFSIKGPITALKAYVGDREEDIIKPLLTAGYEKDQIMNSIGGIEL